MDGARATAEADSTAVRVALWRALHTRADPPPHILDDDLGLRIAAPDGDWRARPDMDAEGTRGLRAAIVARARFVEDLVLQQAERGVGQYVILGAGLDTFAQRRPDAAARLRVFEVDQPGPQAFKRRRLEELSLGVPEWLRFVPVDFEAGDSWWARLAAAGFDPARPAVVVSTGVTMYLTRDAVAATLRRIAGLAPGTTCAMTFLLPRDHVAPDERELHRRSEEGARASGTPFRSYFTPRQMAELAEAAGFAEVRHVPAQTLAERYFSGREDGLRPATAERLLVATV
ncbi:class I SAM-dependent methyltransferase [Streptomyces boncukensis]|uniref:S-adenosyl-L-methionine-dependent methyltransferase n=1 Tax=Streptomyces boncukensis TaxID=2711219 RepID=A0A6G4X007_9ACTN|nr:class I SAM-dependent methyltransferase [Streptomyces boncukensis]NGO70220.1 class I SAM-dependent methyltransferase [Streptomyces boncukensis]